MLTRIQRDQFRVCEYAVNDPSSISTVSLFLNSLPIAENDQMYQSYVSDFCQFLERVKGSEVVELTGLMELISAYEEERGVPKESNFARQEVARTFRYLVY